MLFGTSTFFVILPWLFCVNVDKFKAATVLYTMKHFAQKRWQKRKEVDPGVLTIFCLFFALK